MVGVVGPGYVPRVRGGDYAVSWNGNLTTNASPRLLCVLSHISLHRFLLSLPHSPVLCPTLSHLSPLTLSSRETPAACGAHTRNEASPSSCRVAPTEAEGSSGDSSSGAGEKVSAAAAGRGGSAGAAASMRTAVLQRGGIVGSDHTSREKAEGGDLGLVNIQVFLSGCASSALLAKRASILTFVANSGGSERCGRGHTTDKLCRRLGVPASPTRPLVREDEGVHGGEKVEPRGAGSWHVSPIA